MAKIEWEDPEFMSDIISCLPDIGNAIKLISHFQPPDYEPNNNYHSLFNEFPNESEDLEWQIKFSLMPLFDVWFNTIKGSRYPDPYTKEDLENENIIVDMLHEDHSFAYQTHLAFSILVYLATLGQILPLGKVTLYLLSDPVWGEVINTAACISLLSLGEKNVPIQKLKNVFGNPLVNLESKWESTYIPNKFKQYQIYDPNTLPLSYWKKIFNTLEPLITKEDDILFSMLSYAQQYGHQLGREISILSLKLGLFKPLPISLLLNCKNPLKSDLVYFNGVLANSEFCTTYPEFAKELQSSLYWYKM